MVYRAIPRNRSLAIGWLAFWVMAIRHRRWRPSTILSGNASVLYTFYAPLKASPWFYIGATLLVVGTWIVLVDLVASTRCGSGAITQASGCRWSFMVR